MKYPKSVEAARSIGMDKKALAEALLAEVPLRKGRPAAGTTSVEDALAVIAAEIEAETGEVYAPVTLRDYRLVAEWVGNGSGTTVILRTGNGRVTTLI